MRRLAFVTLVSALSTTILSSLEAQHQANAEVVAAAVSPLPNPLRDGATVMQFNADGTLTQIRNGTGQMICLSDDPRAEGFHPACYHRDLEPFMARGRALKAEGKDGNESRAIRFEEVKAGKLAMPYRAMALYSLTGPAGSFNSETGEAPEARGLHVVYLPYSTEETLGISTAPARNRPWLMHPGTPGAHIMISIHPATRP